jgi:DNA polymerase-4
VWDRSALHDYLLRMVDASATSLRHAGLAARTITVKLRFSDFSTITRSHSMASAIDASPAVAAVAAALLDSVDLSRGVRLLGVSLSGFGDTGAGLQLSLDLGPEPMVPAADAVAVTPEGRGTGAADLARGPGDGSGEPTAAERLARAHREAERIQQSWGSVTTAIDAIRARYGGSSVGPASLVGSEGLRVRRRGESQWGPTGELSPSTDDETTTTL